VPVSGLDSPIALVKALDVRSPHAVDAGRRPETHVLGVHLARPRRLSSAVGRVGPLEAARPGAVDGPVAPEPPFGLLHGADRGAAGRQAAPHEVAAVGHNHRVATQVEHSNFALRFYAAHHGAQGDGHKCERNADPPPRVLRKLHFSHVNNRWKINAGVQARRSLQMVNFDGFYTSLL
jgi:hypothetical protein